MSPASPDAPPVIVTPAEMLRERAVRSAAVGGSRVPASLRLWRGVRRRVRAGLRAENPTASEEELDRLLTDRLRSVRRFENRRVDRPAPPDPEWTAFCRERGVL